MATVEDYVEGWVGTYLDPTEENIQAVLSRFPFGGDREITPASRKMLETLDEGHGQVEMVIREVLTDVVDEEFASILAPALAGHVHREVLSMDAATETVPSSIQVEIRSWLWDDIHAGRLDALEDLYKRHGEEELRAAVERWDSGI